MGIPLQALIVEDSADDADLLVRGLRRGGYEVKSERVETAVAMQEALDGWSWDIVISDYRMPQFSGLEALSILRQRDPDIPFILVSGAIGEEQAVAAMRAGAHDYVMKDELARLVPAVERELVEAETRRQRRRAEQDLARANRALQAIRRCNQALVRATDESQLLNDVCRVIVDIGGYRLAWVGFAERDQRKSVRAVAQAGRDEGFVAAAEITWGDGARGRGPVGTAIRTGVPRVARNIRTDPFFEPWREEALKLDLECSAAFPLLDDGKPFGSLNVYSEQADAFDSEETSLLAELADDLSYGITSLRTRAERQRAERALRKNEERFRLLYERAPLGYQSLDEHGYFLEVNQAWLETLGYRREEVIGHWFGNFLAGESLPYFKLNFPCFKSSGEIKGVQFEMVHKDGNHIFVEFNGRIGYDGHGEFKQTHCVLQDITERRQAEEELRKSEENYREIFNATTDAMFLHDADTLAILDINQAVLDMFGYSREEALGLTVGDLSAEDPRYSQQIAADLVKQGPGIFEWRCRRRDKTTFSVEVAIKSTQIGGEGRILAVVRDITERKKAEEALRESEMMNRSLLEGSPVCNKIIDLDFKLQYMSAAGVKHLKIPNIQSYYGQTYPPEFYPESMRTPLIKGLKLAMAGTTSAVEAPVHDMEGNEVWYHTTFVPAFDDDGLVKYVIGSSVNITERKTAEEELARHRDHLEELVQERTRQLKEAQEELLRKERLATIGQVAASMAHELRNPLGAVRNAAYYLRNHVPTDQPEWMENLSIIDQEVGASDQIIRNLLEMSRPKQPIRQAVDLARLVEEVCVLIAAPKGVRWKCSFDSEPFVVAADPGQLRQVLSNLITNAVQATEEDRDGTIVVGAARTEEYDTITVQDNGSGIAAQHRDRLFEPLFSTKVKGTGLGLAICRQVIEQHGGTIDLVESTGGGATFCIRLPRDR